VANLTRAGLIPAGSVRKVSKTPLSSLTHVISSPFPRLRLAHTWHFYRDALVEAVSAHDSARAATILGFTEAEANALNARMDQLRVQIFLAFPDVEKMAVGYAGSSCGFSVADSHCDVRAAVDNAAAAVSAMDNLLAFMNMPQGSNRPVSCHWGPYTASLVLCTTLGPVLYWPCAYVALCSFCEGGWVDSACS